MSKLHGIVLAALLGASVVANAGVTDISLGASVTEIGSTFGQSPGWGGAALAAPGSLTNGSFLPMGNQWNTNTVFWTSNADYLQINLNGSYSISNIVLQADNNDIYQVSYLHNGTWTTLGDLSPTISGTVNGNGTLNQNGTISWGLGLGSGIGQGITASSFRIQAVGGDNSYGVGQFQAYGVAAIPEPGVPVLMAAGLFALAFARRRFKA
jgi:hypothetical protein